MKKIIVLFLFMSTLFIIAATHAEASNVKQQDTLEKYFTGYTGTFILFDEEKDEYLIFNEPQSEKPLSPCSTFKIYNSLIGLETGVLQDENTILHWDGTQYPLAAWNKDHTLATAIKASAVWYYQEVATRIGPTRMQYYLDLIPYGNADISGGINNFWLSSSIKISAKEQVELLKRLYANDLPFSPETMDITKKILILSSNNNITFSGKTGSGGPYGMYSDPNEQYTVGWFVGEIENNGKRYFFATNIEGDKTSTGIKAKEISILILKDMGLL